MLREGQWVLFLYLVCFGVESSINHHEHSIAEIFTPAEDCEFSGKLLSKILCLVLLRDFCLICTFSITLLCHRKTKECVREKTSKRRQIKQPEMCSSSAYAVWVCAQLQGRCCWRSAAVQQVSECSAFTGTPGKATMKTSLQQGWQWRNTFPRASHAEKPLKFSQSGVVGVFLSSLTLNQGERTY